MTNLKVNNNDAGVWASYSRSTSLNKDEPEASNLKIKDVVTSIHDVSAKDADKAKAEPIAVNAAPQTSERKTDIRFDLNAETNSIVVKVIDAGTEKVLMQIPSVEAVNAAISSDKVKGFFINVKA